MNIETGIAIFLAALGLGTLILIFLVGYVVYKVYKEID